MSNARKPSIVFITGSFCTPSFYTSILDPLTSKDYDIICPELLTVGKKPGVPTTMYDDAAMIASELKKLVDQGKEVVVIGHSYGGVPITEGSKGLSKKEREEKGQKGGIVRLAYLSALVPDVGMSGGETMEERSEKLMELDADGWLYHPNPALTGKYVFNHLSPDEATAWSAKFPNHSAVSFADKLTYAGYKIIPSSYMFCEDDMCVPPPDQQKGIDRIEAATGRKVDVTRVPYDHCPTISHPEGVVEWIEGLVEKGGKWD